MTATTTETTPTTAPGIQPPTTDEFINGLAELMAHSARTPILRWPDEYGLPYEDVFFPAQDGVTLEGWFIPADSQAIRASRSARAALAPHNPPLGHDGAIPRRCDA